MTSGAAQTREEGAQTGAHRATTYNLVQAFGVVLCDDNSSPASQGVHVLNIHGGRGQRDFQSRTRHGEV